MLLMVVPWSVIVTNTICWMAGCLEGWFPPPPTKYQHVNQTYYAIDYKISTFAVGLFLQVGEGGRTVNICLFLQVGEGGRTVFPRVGAGVQPKAGSAVFW